MIQVLIFENSINILSHSCLPSK